MTPKAKKGKHREKRSVQPAVLSQIRTGREWDRAVPVLFLLLTVILFAGFLFSSRMLFGTDTIPMGYAARKALADLVRSTGSLPLWNPYIMGGIPMVDGLMGGDMFYPTTLLQFIMPVHRAIGLKLVIHVFLAGWFFYLFAREKGGGRPASLVGGVSYMFAPYLISLIYAGHDGKLFVASLLPLGFFSLERLLRRALFRDFLLFGFSIGLLILTAHLQLAFFACGAFAFRFFWQAVVDWKKGDRKKIIHVAVLFAGAALLGAALGAVQTWPAYRYTSRFSPRAGGVTYEFATSWSIHWEEAVSLAVPEFGNYLDNYWGKNPFKLNCESPGLIALLLVTAGFFRLRRDRDLRFWYVLLGLSLVYALGAETPFFRLIYMVVPKFFRAPSTILFLFSFGASAIAVRVLDALWSGEDRKKLLTGFAIFGGSLFLLFLLVSSGEGFFRFWGSLFHEGLAGSPRLDTALANVPNVQAGILIGLVSIALFVGLTEAGRRGRWPVEWVAVGTALIVFLGAARTDRDFVKAVPLEDFVSENQLIREMKKDDGIFRVLSALPSLQGNYFSIFGIEAARGFFDNKTKWYDEISSPENMRNGNILNLLNVKYVVSGPGVRHPSFTEVASEGGMTLYRNNDVLPRAFLASRYEVLERDEMIPRLTDGSIEPGKVLLVEEDPGFPSAAAPAGESAREVRWDEYSPNRLRLTVSAKRPSMLFVGNAWLPYWIAEVDGKSTPLLRADYAFQAVPVPAGDHQVTIRFHSPPYVAARAVTLAALLFLTAGALLVFLKSRKGGESGE